MTPLLGKLITVLVCLSAFVIGIRWKHRHCEKNARKENDCKAATDADKTDEIVLHVPTDANMFRLGKHYYIEILWSDNAWQTIATSYDLSEFYNGEAKTYPFTNKKVAMKVLNEIKEKIG